MGSTGPERSLRPLARLDSESGRWLDSSPCTDDLFSEPSPSLLERWPSSGMTRNGVLYQLPKSGPHTDASGYSLLPTPRASRGASTSETRDALLPTPRVAADRTSRSAAMRKDSMSAPSLAQAIEIARGELPREFTSWDEVPESWQP
ncbi:Uncharacterised protein [Mycobacteroides abscessus subsp. abscessus]|nr:Uncharacterised protein [Mycobacteroides abscessus subsp. abscessus]